MLVFGILSGILTVVAIFQTRLGSIKSDIKSDMHAMEDRLGKQIDTLGKRIDTLGNRVDSLKDDIHSVENRLNLRIDGVKAELTENIQSAENRLGNRIDSRETEPKPDAEAV